MIKYVNNFEETAAEIAIENGYQYVVCGHIHQPQIREISTKKGSTTYLNSGDWVENSTSLEYHDGQWKIYQHEIIESNSITRDEELHLALSYELLMKELVQAPLVHE